MAVLYGKWGNIQTWWRCSSSCLKEASIFGYMLDLSFCYITCAAVVVIVYWPSNPRHEITYTIYTIYIYCICILQALRDMQPVSFFLQTDKLIIQTQDMDLAAELVQSLLKFLDIREMNAIADFPGQIQDLQDVLTNVNEIQGSRIQLSADLAERSTLAKSLLLRAEDARLLDEM